MVRRTGSFSLRCEAVLPYIFWNSIFDEPCSITSFSSRIRIDPALFVSERLQCRADGTKLVLRN